MIAKGLITKRANEERLPAHTIEPDYVLAHLCADIGAIGDPRLVFKGGTLLRLCLLPDYRYSADLDFSAVDGLSAVDAVDIVDAAVERCRTRGVACEPWTQRAGGRRRADRRAPEGRSTPSRSYASRRSLYMRRTAGNRESQ